jgi:hypothetical protein
VVVESAERVVAAVAEHQVGEVGAVLEVVLAVQVEDSH